MAGDATPGKHTRETGHLRLQFCMQGRQRGTYRHGWQSQAEDLPGEHRGTVCAHQQPAVVARAKEIDARLAAD
ncbi:hypothetical protein [Stenotrophomonas sp. CFBP 13718]|uniref:hypothetical protein n=1 Tax=Stenotrophomonas sp. CFBP 13718 TaxID=2775304 RepID=UPI00177A8DE1|nr:hypothetical protein [Stenotrophomonas sp. CFBP 13718]MBD8695138.1 hypothetical protein [Stenotrophomonas sp. CFBP 13718]